LRLTRGTQNVLALAFSLATAAEYRSSVTNLRVRT
jgi:hypothetical protein